MIIVAKYLDCDPLIEEMRRYKCGEEDYDEGIETAVSVCAVFPSVNVRPVVYCEDCANTRRDSCDDAIYCKVWDIWEMPPDGYCYKGKMRKE